MSTLRVNNLTAVGGTGTITVPANNVLTQAGTILQVVSATTTTQVTTTSATYVSSTLTGSITPSSTSNKIIVICSFALGKETNNVYASPRAQLFRGTVSGTAISSTISAYQTNNGNGGTVNISMVALDSPNTTSSQTYTVGIAIASNLETATAQRFGFPSTMLLMEVAG